MVAMKIHKIVFILIIGGLLTSRFVSTENSQAAEAPVTDELGKVKAQLDADYWAHHTKDQPPQWDQKLEVLSAKANALVAEYDRMVAQEQSMLNEEKQLKADIENQKSANASLKEQISRQKILTNEKRLKAQAQLELKAIQDVCDVRTKDLESLDRQINSLDQKIKLGRLKLASLGLDVNKELQAQEAIAQLETQISQAEEQELLLKNRLDQLHNAQKPLDPSVKALTDEIDGLKTKIADIDSGKDPRPDPRLEMETLTRQKKDLQSDIDRLKGALGKIEHQQTLGIAHQRIKSLVDEISVIDIDNGKTKEQIAILKENIAILKLHIRKLGYEADFIKAMKSHMGGGPLDDAKGYLKEI
jgi:chromosome segregation ATPase